MNEAEWLTSSDPRAMLDYLRGPGSWEPASEGGPVPRHVSDRKLRLFACACCRAAGRTPVSEIDRWERDGNLGQDTDGDWARSWAEEGTAEVSGAAQAALLRCVAGNPFRPIPVLPSTIASYACDWFVRVPAIRPLATAIYESRRWEEMSVLADALEEAGCQNAAILGHLRGHDGEECLTCMGSGFIPVYTGHGNINEPDCDNCNGTGRVPGPHARGCWAIDCLLGKS